MKPKAIAGYLSTLLLVLPAAYAGAESYEILPADGSRMDLTIEKTGLLSGKKHLFTFDQYRGMLQFDASAPEDSRIELVIESRSALCRDAWVSAKDLRKIQEFAIEDMLAVERYPKMVFRSEKITKLDADHYEAQGTLTIREVTKPVMISVSLSKGANGSLSLEGRAKLRLTDYNLKPPTAILGTIGTKNEMSFTFAVTALPQARSGG